MTRDEAAEAAEVFLKQYLHDHTYFTDPDEMDDDGDPRALRLFFYRAIPHWSDLDTIYLSFTFGRAFRKDDPELDALIEQCIGALQEARPEVFRYRMVVGKARQT